MNEYDMYAVQEWVGFCINLYNLTKWESEWVYAMTLKYIIHLGQKAKCWTKCERERERQKV